MPSPSYEDEQQKSRDADAREMGAAHRWIRLGYKPIAVGDKQVRRTFEVKGHCADLVFGTRPNTCIVADSKGKNIGIGIEQLKNTVPYVAKFYTSVEPRILIHLAGNPVPMQSIGGGCVAIRQRESGQYILHDANSAPVLLPGGQSIEVEFW